MRWDGADTQAQGLVKRDFSMRTGRAISKVQSLLPKGLGRNQARIEGEELARAILIGERNLYRRRIHVDARDGVFHKVP